MIALAACRLFHPPVSPLVLASAVLAARPAAPTPAAAAAAIAPLPLALGDGLTVALAVFQLAFSAVVSIALWRLTAWQRRYEGLEGRLHEATTRLVEERFRALAHEVNGHVQGFVLALEDLKQRIRVGDAEVRAMGERDQRIELAVVAKIDLLKDYLREFAAGKKDLEKHETAVERKLGQIEQRLGEITGTVAVLSDRMKEQ